MDFNISQRASVKECITKYIDQLYYAKNNLSKEEYNTLLTNVIREMQRYI